MENFKLDSLDFVSKVTKLGKENGIPVHLDGARLFNASVASGVSPARIVQGFSSVSICLSKGLGSPFGSLLVGDKDFIRQWVKKFHILYQILRLLVDQLGINVLRGIWMFYGFSANAIQNSFGKLKYTYILWFYFPKFSLFHIFPNKFQILEKFENFWKNLGSFGEILGKFGKIRKRVFPT